MKNNLLCSFLLSVFVGEICSANIPPERIRSSVLDRGKVTRIYMAPGMGSLLNLPCSIAEILVGRESELTARVSTTTKSSLYLNLNSSSSTPTNLIVRCDRRNVTLVFDVIPSKLLHQDVFDVKATIGGPVLDGSSIEVVASSERSKTLEPALRQRKTIQIQRPILATDKSGRN